MSAQNVEVVRELLSTFERADYEAALQALDPEIEWQVPPGVSIGQETYRGRDEVRRGFAEWLGAWETHTFEPDEWLDHGDQVVVSGLQLGRGRASGVDVRLRTFHVFTLRDSKITRHRSYPHRTEALAAAGLSE